ncbi:hypothetical protein CF326_g10060 [Tilletia indica]|nr:hypothetical protein CF326_g10060 [Tilletia indica]
MQGFEAGTYHIKQENVSTTEIKPFREQRSDLSEYGSMIPLSECGRLYGIPEETIAVLTAKGFRTPHAVVDMDEEDAKELKLERGERRVIRTVMKLWRMASGTAEGSGASSSTQAREPLAHEVQIPSAVLNKNKVQDRADTSQATE